MADMKFSIITPSYRNSNWLRLCVASVADQHLSHEHLVQDAGSDDGTLDWLSRDSRVQLVVEKDSGMYDAINRGLRRARGEYIAYLNCDEQYLPGALEVAGRFLDENPGVDVLFGNAVAVNPAGDYLWHRKMLVPKLWHTSVCPLSTLTCATFFRRSLLERGFLFDTRWRYVGDSDWVLRLLLARVPMAVLRRFTSVFTHTGSNLSLQQKALDEAQDFFRRAPGWRQSLRPAILLHHRFRRLLGGGYSQMPFDFELFTASSPNTRVRRHVARPTGRWKW